MKKCASCTKDLPDAALHCVFCGAKQAPAPAAQPGVAKTVMGYSSPEMLAQLRAQQAATQAPPAPVAPTPVAPPPVAAHGAQAATMFAPGPPPGMAQANPATMQTLADPNMRAHTPSAPPPVAHTPSGPNPVVPLGAMSNDAFGQTLPAAGNSPYSGGYVPAPSSVPVEHGQAVAPYAQSQGAMRPIEPWKDTLRTVMFVMGALLVAAFCLPLRTDPMIFNWDVIIHAEGMQKLQPLILGGVGVLSIVFAALPMATAARGMLAAILGLAGALIPMLLDGMPEWPILSMTIGMVLLIPGLIVRDQYRDAALPRILVTVGAIGVLLPFLIPLNGKVMIVQLFTGIAELPGALKLVMAVMAGFVVVSALSLLAWLPAPSGAGAKLFAWLLILWGAITFATILIASGAFGELGKEPFMALSWVGGGGEGLGKELATLATLPAAFAALIGYGLATVFGKQLE